MLRMVLLDRDGVLNHDSDDHIKRPEELRMIPGAAAAVARLNQAGLIVCLTTNQSILGRGWVTPAEFWRIQDVLLDALRAEGARLDRIFVAPDAPDRPSARRKPGPGMLLEALAEFAISPEQAVMVGDQPTDARAASAAGVGFHLVRTGKGRRTEAAPPAGAPILSVHDDLPTLVEHLLKEYSA